ncbi:MAG: restriction endonuclease subunit S [Mongoliitalea sp.]
MNQKNHSLDNVPELRFPEFVDDGEWKYLNGDKLFDPITNKNHNSDLPILAITQEHGAIPRDLIDYNVSVTDKSIESYKVVEEGDFIISLRSFQGGIEYSNYLGLCSPAYIILRKKIELENHFYRQYFKSTPFIFDLNRNLEGIRDGKMVSYKQFSEILIPTPRFQEQQKIASCLSSLDELISAHSQKLELLKDHKKGLMQNLFPQEGETVPKYRFPEFEGDGEWVEKKLGDKEVSSFVNEKISVNELSIDSYISTENMMSDYSGVATSSKLPSSGNFTKFRIGDILISNIRPYLKKVWKSDKMGGASNDVLVFRSGSMVVCDFLEFTIKNDSFINYVMESAKGVKMPRGDKDSMQEYTVFIPSKAEQKKIASCLSAVDELIAAQGEKIEQLKLHKKGLMQGLFPKAV